MGSPENFDAVIGYLLKNKNTFRLVFDNGNEKTERARVFISEQHQTTYLLLSLQRKGGKAGYLEAISSQEQPLLEKDGVVHSGIIKNTWNIVNTNLPISVILIFLKKQITKYTHQVIT